MSIRLFQWLTTPSATLIASAVLALCEFPAHAAVVKALYSATNSMSGLVLAADGNFYGTTRFGGNHDFGAVFRMTPGGQYQQIYSFTGGTDGGNPRAALAAGPDNQLYGTCQYGGNQEGGTIFRISTNGSFGVLRMLDTATDGAGPIGGLALGPDGLLYGTASFGGAFGLGTIFRVSTIGTFNVLRSFSGSDGDCPAATLMAGPGNALYGSTRFGGPQDRGTLFRISTSGVFASFLSFDGENGEMPQAPLVSGPGGELYGTTTYGGNHGLGTIFKTTTNGTLTPIYAFTDENLGANPSTGLRFVNGLFQGTVDFGGTNGFGAVFQITPQGGLNLRHEFNSVTDGATPSTTLVSGNDGRFYGTTEFGGVGGGGTFYQLDSPRPYFDAVARIAPDQVRYTGGGGTYFGPYTVLTALNPAAPPANWTTNRTGVFDAAGRFSFTNGLPGAWRFYWLRMP